MSEATTGQSPPCLAKNSRMASGWSLKATLTTCTGSPSCAWANFTSSGCSTRHGPHQVAKKLTSTHSPRWADRLNGWPVDGVAAEGRRGLADDLAGQRLVGAPGGEQGDERRPSRRRRRWRRCGRCGAGGRGRRWRTSVPSVTLMPAPPRGRGARGRRRRSASGSGGEEPDRAPGSGADTGSMGLRRRPGKTASSVPRAITAPPIQSQITSGWIVTRRVIELSSPSGTLMSERATSSRRVERTDGRADGLRAVGELVERRAPGAGAVDADERLVDDLGRPPASPAGPRR